MCKSKFHLSSLLSLSFYPWVRSALVWSPEKLFVLTDAWLPSSADGRQTTLHIPIFVAFFSIAFFFNSNLWSLTIFFFSAKAATALRNDIIPNTWNRITRQLYISFSFSLAESIRLYIHLSILSSFSLNRQAVYERTGLFAARRQKDESGQSQ